MEPVHVVTTETVPGHEIVEVKGLVWGTSVRSKFLGKDIIAFFRTLLGGEVKEYTHMVNDARRFVLQRMARNARALGANAVVGVRIGSTAQVIPGTVELFAYGTAVKIRPVKKRKRK